MVFSVFRYVHNNIFFSFAIDADLEQLSKKRSKIATGDSLSVKTSRSGVPNGEKCDESCRVDHDNATELDCNLSSETQSAETEQATYASANNDLKGTKAYQEADVPGIYNLAMAIIDFKGHRVVAQVGVKACPLFLRLHIVSLFLCF